MARPSKAGLLACVRSGQLSDSERREEGPTAEGVDSRVTRLWSLGEVGSSCAHEERSARKMAGAMVFACPHCEKRMKAVPPAPAFSVTCVACRKVFTVHTAPAAEARPLAHADEPTQPPPAEDSGEVEVTEGVTPSSEVFAEYRPSLQIAGALPHPAEIVESQSLAATSAPHVLYTSVYEQPGGPLHAVLLDGRLSALQLETVVLCGARHARLLPNGRRAGFFLGDGAGVGKGRQIAGVILDNLARGRKKHVWFSTSTDLRLDAERDFADLGAPGVGVHNGCQKLDSETRGLGLSASHAEGARARRAGTRARAAPSREHRAERAPVAPHERVLARLAASTGAEPARRHAYQVCRDGRHPRPPLSPPFALGVLFSTYAALVSASRVGKGGVSRLEQLVEWCGGASFDGCLVFDECAAHRTELPPARTAPHCRPRRGTAAAAAAAAPTADHRAARRARRPQGEELQGGQRGRQGGR